MLATIDYGVAITRNVTPNQQKTAMYTSMYTWLFLFGVNANE
jgi:hypothetical protein